MDHGTLALMIPLAPFALGGFAIWTRHQRRLMQMRADAHVAMNSADNAASAQRFAALEDRVRVLERIVTDRGSNLAAEIEALRRADLSIAAKD